MLRCLHTKYTYNSRYKYELIVDRTNESWTNYSARLATNIKILVKNLQ